MKKLTKSEIDMRVEEQRKLHPDLDLVSLKQKAAAKLAEEMFAGMKKSIDARFQKDIADLHAQYFPEDSRLIH